MRVIKEQKKSRLDSLRVFSGNTQTATGTTVVVVLLLTEHQKRGYLTTARREYFGKKKKKRPQSMKIGQNRIKKYRNGSEKRLNFIRKTIPKPQTRNKHWQSQRERTRSSTFGLCHPTSALVAITALCRP